MVDVDHFTAVNDIFGHVVGDAVPRIIAARLRHAVDEPQSRTLAEPVRHAIGVIPIATGGNQTIPVVIGAGCALRPVGRSARR